MKTILYLFFAFVLSAVIGCSDDDPVNPPPVTGEVLLATVAGDSAGTGGSGASTRSSSITSSQLNFTDRDSVRISFFYSGQNSIVTNPFTLSYTIDTTSTQFFGPTLTPSTTEQFMNVVIPSPHVNAFCKYQIITISLSGPSYFKFRDLNIYKR